MVTSWAPARVLMMPPRPVPRVYYPTVRKIHSVL